MWTTSNLLKLCFLTLMISCRNAVAGATNQIAQGIYIVGGNAVTGYPPFSHKIHRLNPDSNTVETLHNSTRYNGWTTAKGMGNGKVLFMGYSGPIDYNLYEYDPMSRNISTLVNQSSLNLFPTFMDSTIVGEKFVACGRKSRSSFCLVYNTADGNWRVMDILGDYDFYYGCLLSKNETHVLWIGGKTNSVLLIDILTGKLSVVAEMQHHRGKHSCATLGDSAIICGGENATSSFSSCTSFNMTNFLWNTTKITDMKVKRIDFQLINWDDKLFAIGGYFDEDIRHYLSSVEINENGVWNINHALQLPTELEGFGAAVIN